MPGNISITSRKYFRGPSVGIQTVAKREITRQTETQGERERIELNGLFTTKYKRAVSPTDVPRWPSLTKDKTKKRINYKITVRLHKVVEHHKRLNI